MGADDGTKPTNAAVDEVNPDIDEYEENRGTYAFELKISSMNHENPGSTQDAGPAGYA